MRKKMLLKENNDGLSLVEVLVSVTILAVVLIPLMAGFSNVSTSTRNLKSIQKGTTLAQNVIENVKENSMESVKKNFNFDEGLKGYNIEDSYEADANNLNGALTSVDSSCYKDDSGNIVYRDREDGMYNFVYKGVKDGSDKYDVVVTMNSGNYYSDEIGKNYNKTSLSSIAGLDSKRTAVISTTNDITNKAIEMLSGMTNDDSTTIANNLTMCMNIDFSGDDSISDGEMLVTASPTYIYHSVLENYEYSPGYIFQKSYSVAEAQHLERIYFLYSQSTCSVKNRSDEIILNVKDESNLGNTATPPALYIVKQGTSSEVGKNLDITCNDDSYFSNLFSDIRGNMNVSSLNKSQYALMVRGDNGLTNNKVTLDSLSYKYVESDKILEDDTTPTSEGDHSENRVYDVTVKVYKSGSDFTDVVATLTSTRRE